MFYIQNKIKFKEKYLSKIAQFNTVIEFLTNTVGKE